MNASELPLGVMAVMLPELDLDEQLSLCRSLGVTHYTLRPRVIPDAERGRPYSNWGNHKFDLTPQRLLDEAATIREQLDDAGIMAFGTAPSAKTADADEQLRVDLEGAAAVGAGRVRVNPSPYPDRPFDYEAQVRREIDRYAELVEMARPLGIKLVIETHSRSLAASPALAWNICRHFDPADVGVIFDLANFSREGEIQPHLAVSVLGKYIDHCHVGASRRVSVGRDEDGFEGRQSQFCAMADGDLHLPTWLKALSQAKIRVPLVIEDYTADVPGAQRLTDSVQQLRLAMAAADRSRMNGYSA